MANNPSTLYPTQSTPPTPGYPYGGAKNVLTPGDGTGTPWEKALLDDLWGMQQAFLTAAGIVPSGIADAVNASQYLEAINSLHLLESPSVTGAKARLYVLDGMAVNIPASGVWDYVPAATLPVSANVVNHDTLPLQIVKRDAPIAEVPDGDLSSLFDNQRSIVVAGDSLSFNAYDWPVPTNPLNYAYENNSPGLMSWAHMMRDFCYRSDVNFIHADNVPFRIEGDAVVTTNDSTLTDRYFLPFNNRSVRMVGKNKTDVVQFVVPCNKVRTFVRTHCVSTPTSATADAGRVDVSFKTYPYNIASEFKVTVETGGRTDYFELDPFFADFGAALVGTYPVLVEFSNWRTTADLDPPAQGIQLQVSAFSETASEFRLTGHGGYTMAQVEAEKDTMITDFAPELLFLICGANDRATGVSSASFIASLTSVVNATRAANATSEIVFMTTTHASDAMFQPGVVLNGETIDEWLASIKQAVLDLGCRYFDTYHLFDSLDPSEWRFDNVHMTKYGNKFLFDSMVNRFFTSAIANKRIDWADPQIDAQLALTQTDKEGTQPIQAGSELYVFDEGTLAYNMLRNPGAQAVIKSVTRVNAFTLRVESNYPLLRDVSALQDNSGLVQGEGRPLVDLRLSKYGSPITEIIRTDVAAVSRYSADFFLLDYGVSPPTAITDLQNDGQQYVVSWA